MCPQSVSPLNITHKSLHLKGYFWLLLRFHQTQWAKLKTAAALSRCHSLREMKIKPKYNKNKSDSHVSCQEATKKQKKTTYRKSWHRTDKSYHRQYHQMYFLSIAWMYIIKFSATEMQVGDWKCNFCNNYNLCLICVHNSLKIFWSTWGHVVPDLIILLTAFGRGQRFFFCCHVEQLIGFLC